MFDVEGPGCKGVNVGIPMVEVLITPVRPVGYNQSQ